MKTFIITLPSRTLFTKNRNSLPDMYAIAECSGTEKENRRGRTEGAVKGRMSKRGSVLSMQ